MKKKHSMLKKYTKIFTFGLAAFLIIEVGALIFIDKSYLAENTNDITVQQIKNDVTSDATVAKMELAGSEQDIKVSYDGKFIAYTQNGELQVANIQTGAKSTLKMAENMKLAYYKWVYDRDRLIVAESSKYNSYVKLYTLETKALKSQVNTSSTFDSTASVSEVEPEEIRDTINNQKVSIKMPTSDYKITDIDCSTSTVITYLKLTNSNGNSRLWKLNLPNENKMYSSISTRTIGKIQSLKDQPELLYENTTKGNVCVAGQGMLTINGTSKYQILGFDKLDNVYLAKGNSKSVSEIVYGSLMKKNTSTDELELTLKPEMTSVKLEKSVDIDKIYVTFDGSIYTVDDVNNEITNVISNKKVTYSGKFVSFYSKGFITREDNTICQNSLQS